MGNLKELIEQRHKDGEFQTFWDLISFMLSAGFDEHKALRLGYDIFDGDVWDRVIRIEQYEAKMERIPVMDPEAIPEEDFDDAAAPGPNRTMGIIDRLYNNRNNSIGNISTQEMLDLFTEFTNNTTIDTEDEDTPQPPAPRYGGVSDIQDSIMSYSGMSSFNTYADFKNNDEGPLDNIYANADQEIELPPIPTTEVEKDDSERYKFYILNDDVKVTSKGLYQSYLDEADYEPEATMDENIRTIMIDVNTMLLGNLIAEFNTIDKKSMLVDKRNDHDYGEDARAY